MYPVLIAGFNYALRIIFAVARFKFVVASVIYMICAGLLYFILAMLPDITGLCDVINMLPDGVIYFMRYFQLPLGIPIVLSAVYTAFLIRRVPFLG